VRAQLEKEASERERESIARETMLRKKNEENERIIEKLKKDLKYWLINSEEANKEKDNVVFVICN
jgi:hypothetical protein